MKQILCFGDSNTYGLIPGTKNRYGWGIRWTSLVDEHFRRMGYRVTEEGLCGRTTFFQDATRPGRKGTELLPVLLEAHSPIDLLVLMLGTNDCKTSYQATPEKIGEGIEVLLDQVQSTHPEIQILLVSPISLGDRVWEEDYDTEFDRNSVEVSRQLPFVYAEIAKRRGVAFLAASDFADPSSTDREHLDMLGHKRLAQGIQAKLQEMLGQKHAEENVS